MAHTVFNIYILTINHHILKIMKTIYIYILILFGVVLSSNLHSQTLTKTASKSSVYIGEIFTYKIEVKNVTSLSDLDRIVDDFGIETDILAVRYSPAMQLLTTWSFCNGITQNINTTQTSKVLEVAFDNCNGSTSMLNSFYIEIDVRFNEQACNLSSKINSASLLLNSSTNAITASHTIAINHSNPFELQKSFFKYDSGYLYYDIRLSSKSGNFGFLDFGSESFLDEFTLPNCFQNVASSDIETVYIPDVTDRTNEVSVPNNSNISGNQLRVKWSLPTNISVVESSILFAVKIKVADCQCANLFDLKNSVSFDFKNICRIDFSMSDSFDLEGISCDLENSIPSECNLVFEKTFKLDDNDLGLTMKGCTGEYIIDIKNCSNNLEFGKIILSDLVPSELDILGIDPDGWNYNQTGNQINLGANLSPGESLQVKIRFRVNTNIPDTIIRNCADIQVWGENIYTSAPINFNETSCTHFITVPNKVTVVTRKSICSKAEKDCGDFDINSNDFNINYLPNDDVEYELFFYNYGNKDGERVKITDRLPNFLRVMNPSTDIKVYKAQSGDPDLKASCELSGYSDITSSVDINYSPSGLNQLDIKLDNHILDAFTCKGVSFYKVRVKGRIQQNAPSGTYDNQFIVEYNEPPSSIRKTVISEKEPYSINIDNLILGSKQWAKKTPDCENHTQTVTYRILVANMGTMPVNIDIVDGLNVPNNVSIITGPSNFNSCITTGNTSLCSPIPINNPATTFSNFSSSNTGFSIIRESLAPCSVLVLEYDVVFDTELLNSDEEVESCYELNVSAYTGNRRPTPMLLKKNPEKYDNNIVVSLDPALNALYTNAQTNQERLDAILLMKLKKANPELIKKPNDFSSVVFNKLSQKDRRKRFPWFWGTFFGTDTYADCVPLKDCLAGKESGCLNSNGVNNVSLKITGIDNKTGKISTQLINNPPKKITRIEYVLSDVEFSEFCNTEVYYIGPRQITVTCTQCNGNLAGEFRPTNFNAISGLNYLSNSTTNFSNINATYKEWNTAYYEGVPSLLTSVNKDFIFPNIGNCSGNYAFSITAIVYFDDCTTCYSSDVLDFRTYYDWLVPVLNGNNNGGQHTPL